MTTTQVNENVSTPKAHTNGANGAPAPTPTRMIDIGKIRESKWNPRKTFDEVKLAELAESIKSVGVLEDLTVRPMSGDYFEIVFGARRYRAAKLAGCSILPCKVKELDDAKALEIAIVENAQREDVDPLEEAEGFELLHKPKKEGGLGQSVEEIAAKIGKSTGHVYNRLKLAGLGPEARKAYRDGYLTPFTAMIVARIPHRDLQKSAIDWARGASHRTTDNKIEGPSARTFADYVRRNFMLDLARAPFDRKSLTLYAAAGACSTCPKRTGNQIELFGDAGAAQKERDVCTDPKCYAIKLKAHNDERVEVLAKQGAEVLSPAATKKIFGSTGSGDYVHPSTGYVTLSQQCEDDPKYRPFAKLLAGVKITKHVAVAPSGKVVELVRAGEAAKALKESGVLKRTMATGEATRNTYDAQQKEAARKALLRNATTQIVIKRIAENAAKRSPNEKAFWLFLANAFTEAASNDALVRHAVRHGAKDSKEAQAFAHNPKRGLADKTAAELRVHVIELACAVGAWFGTWHEGGLGANVKAAADLFGVDVAKAAAEVRDEAKKRAAKRKPAAKKTAKKGAKAKR